MAGRQKNLSQMVGDVKKGDKVVFQTRDKRVKYYSGYCLSSPSPNNPRGTWYDFSNREEGTPTFAVCPTNRKHQLKPEDSRYKEINNYKIISRAKTHTKNTLDKMAYRGTSFL